MGTVIAWSFLGFGVVLWLFGLWLAFCHRAGQIRCRACGEMGPMALLCESDGVCRECLLEIVEMVGVLKEQGGDRS